MSTMQILYIAALLLKSTMRDRVDALVVMRCVDCKTCQRQSVLPSYAFHPAKLFCGWPGILCFEFKLPQTALWFLKATLVRPDFLCGKVADCSSKRKGSNCPVQVDPCSESSICMKQPELDWRLCCVHQYNFGVCKIVDRFF